MPKDEVTKDEAIQDSELAKIWLSQQDLSKKTPAETKILYFKAWHEMQRTNVERWD